MPKAKVRTTSVPDQEQRAPYVPWHGYLNTRLSEPNPSACTKSKAKTSEHRKIVPMHTFLVNAYTYTLGCAADKQVDLHLQVRCTST